jgi:hypothetical protein
MGPVVAVVDEADAALGMLIEMTAYNVMRLLHELQVERTRMAFGKA